jgi:NADH-quinone oxidoreductase subunit N
MFLTPIEIENLQRKLLSDLAAFAPELILSAAIILMLLMRLFKGREVVFGALGGICLAGGLGGVVLELMPPPTSLVLVLAGLILVFTMLLGRVHQGYFALILTLIAFGANLALLLPQLNVFMPGTWFTGLLAYDHLTTYLRAFLTGFAVLLIWLSILTGIPDREDAADFYTLLLGSTIGMCLMASANHLLMVYIGVEMASLPSYALAGFLKGRRASSEASLKYVVYGGGASGIMLYGISLLAGKFGTAYLPDVALGFSTALSDASSPVSFLSSDPVLVLGSLFILMGIGFKLAAFPFHFWCPDVFEGAAAEVAGFLSVASKGAAIALLGRFVMVLAGLSEQTRPWAWSPWLHTTQYFAVAVGICAALTATFGNLAAYWQSNLKRLLAYSTIAHAGYMMMGLATMTRDGLGAALFYLAAYLFMNLGAFAVVAFLRNQTGSEELSSFRGLIQRSPVLVITLSVFVLSLLGIPPLAGFAAKFQVFRSLFDAGQMYAELKQPGLSNLMYGLLVIGGINTVLSAVYYLKVIKVMVLDRPLEEVEGVPPAPLREPTGWVVYAGLLSAVILVLGVWWDPIAARTGVRSGVASHFRTPPPEVPPPFPSPAGI